jgi:hypothetical protein
MMDTDGQTQSEVAEFFNVPWIPAVTLVAVFGASRSSDSKMYSSVSS